MPHNHRNLVSRFCIRAVTSIVNLKVHPYTFRPENNFLPDSLKCSKDTSKAAERCESGSIKEMQLYFKAGVDGVFTDDPALGRQAVQSYQATK